MLIIFVIYSRGCFLVVFKKVFGVVEGVCLIVGEEKVKVKLKIWLNSLKIFWDLVK